MDGLGGGIFAGCAIAFVPTNSLDSGLLSELSNVLRDHGADILDARDDGSVPIDEVTHIVSNSIDFPQYSESQAFMIPVVSTQWITSSISRMKLAHVRPFSPDPRMIFAQVVVTCADLPVMDKESILGATMALGGQESKDVSRLTTHICALSMDHAKVQTALAKGFRGKIVLPHWFDDCFKLGKRIDEGPYLLPDPEILRKAPEDEVRIPTSARLEGATSVSPQWFPPPSDNQAPRPPATVFRGRKVLLAQQLAITPRLARAIGEIIVGGSGSVVDEVADCDMLICHYRDGQQYLEASRSCKEVGSLSWLYFLIIHNQWCNPLHRLLHYPIPRHGLEGFKGLRITVSNYGGEARIYLENLIKACGAEFTKTMKADNTHLITARHSGEKCKAAPEWGVAIVNHLWIEESYAKCSMKPINIPKYNHFPPRTNLGEIIGQTFLDSSRLRDVYYPGGEETLSPPQLRKRKILEAAEDNAYAQGPAEGLLISHPPDDLAHEALAGDDGDAAGANVRGVDTSRTVATIQTPVRQRRRQPLPGKENDSPSIMSTGSRSAKAKARDLLQHIAPDIALYEKEKKRHSKTGGPWGGKRAADLIEREREESAAKAAAKADRGGADDGHETARPAKKKPRSGLPEVEMRIVVTGFGRWVGSQSKEDYDRRKLRDLGIQIVSETQACDYLAAPRVVRTVKFLCALAQGPTILSTDFIEKVLETGQLVDVAKYQLRDAEAEKQYRMKIRKSEARAKANRGKLLDGVLIYCTEKIRNGAETYRAIAEANGATFKLYRARGGTKTQRAAMTTTKTTATGKGTSDTVYLVSGDSSEERLLWPRFRAMAEEGEMGARVVCPDWLLDVAMAQEVRFDKSFLVENMYGTGGPGEEEEEEEEENDDG